MLNYRYREPTHDNKQKRFIQDIYSVEKGKTNINKQIFKHARIQKVLSEGVQLFFSFDEWRKDPNTSISGLSTARQRNAIKMAFGWRADDGPTLNTGLVAL